MFSLVGSWSEVSGGIYRLPIETKPSAGYKEIFSMVKSSGTDYNYFTCLDVPRHTTSSTTLGEGEYFFNDTTDAGYLFYRPTASEDMSTLKLSGTTNSSAFYNVTNKCTVNRLITVGGQLPFRSSLSGVVHELNYFHALKGYEGGVQNGQESEINWTGGGCTTNILKADALLATDSGGIRGKYLWCRDAGDECVQINAPIGQTKKSFLELESSIVGPVAGKDEGSQSPLNIEANNPAASGSLGLDATLRNITIYDETYTPLTLNGAADAPSGNIITLQNVVVVNNSTANASINANGNSKIDLVDLGGNVWGGSGSGNNSIVGDLQTPIRASGQFLEDIADQFVGGAPTTGLESVNDVVSGSVLGTLGMASGAALDFYLRSFGPNNTGAFSSESPQSNFSGSIKTTLNSSILDAIKSNISNSIQ